MSDAKDPAKKKKSVKKAKPAEDFVPESAASISVPAPEPDPEPAPETKTDTSTKRRAARTGSNVFAMFTQNQIAEFKEIFSFCDQDKDGILSKEDLRTTFDQVGRLSSDRELDDMMKEASGPINFTQFLQIFGNKVAGMDEEDVIYNAFTVFDEGDGLCGEEKLRKMLTTFGERLTEQEATDVFNEAPMNKDGKINLKKWANLLTKGVEEEEQQ